MIDVLNDYSDKTKTAFRQYLDESIRESIKFNKNFNNLDYENDYDNIKKLLLLFNVESVRQIDDRKRRFPFGRHKKENWSLEHIHAQHSEGLQTNEKRKEWLKAHIKSLQSIGQHEELISSMKQLIKEINRRQSEDNKSSRAL